LRRVDEIFVRQQWKNAYEIAVKLLTEDERKQLGTETTTSCTVFSVLEAAEDARKDRDDNKWRYTKKNGEVVILRERFDTIVGGFEKYAKIVDVAIQHHPEVTSLVWASARFLIQVYSPFPLRVYTRYLTKV
jgi:hypothetical protein